MIERVFLLGALGNLAFLARNSCQENKILTTEAQSTLSACAQMILREKNKRGFVGEGAHD
jgi:hypothetical protein